MKVYGSIVVMKLNVMRESLVLLAICFADLFLTVFLLGTRKAVEGNPLMAYYLQFGVGTFVAVKLALMFLPIFIAEWSKQYRPVFVRTMMRFVIGAYVGAYLLMFIAMNIAGIAKSA